MEGVTYPPDVSMTSCTMMPVTLRLGTDSDDMQGMCQQQNKDWLWTSQEGHGSLRQASVMSRLR